MGIPPPPWQLCTEVRTAPSLRHLRPVGGLADAAVLPDPFRYSRCGRQCLTERATARLLAGSSNTSGRGQIRTGDLHRVRVTS